MKFTLAFLFLLFTRIFIASDIVDDLSINFKTGNVAEISKYFSANLELDMLEKEGVYSNQQSQIILKDFFAKHPPISIKVIHKVMSNPNYKLGVFILNTGKGIFRISIELKNIDQNLKITQIRIEENKD